MPAQEPIRPDTMAKDGRNWRIGTAAEVAWITGGTVLGRTITAAIPPVYAAYATIELPDSDVGLRRHERAVLGVLAEVTADQPWWLGYLDTGADDLVFPDAPMLTMYADWHYVLAEAGPEQAGSWRSDEEGSFWRGVLPNLMFPADRSWLLSTLWDDDWTCVGGSAELVRRLLHRPDLRARQVALGQDATPPGFQAL